MKTIIKVLAMILIGCGLGYLVYLFFPSKDKEEENEIF